MTAAARLNGAIPAILRAEALGLPPCADGADVLAEHVTGTGLRIAIVGRPGEEPCLVVKLALTTAAGAGLAREGRALAALHADARLAGWRGLVPRRLASGEMRERRYAVDTAVPGDAGDEGVLAAAAEALGQLHRRTASPIAVDDALVEQWVARPATVLAQHGGRRAARAIGELAAALERALHGRTVSAGWVHGDFWPGNLLVRADGTLGGIVDWDAAAPRELPLHDVLHLVLYSRRLASRAELGELVVEQLRVPKLAPGELRALRAYGAPPADALPGREALLLYWLRHAATHTRQQDHTRGSRYRGWRRRNVDPVLEAL